ncbi:L-glutamate gamma-semialdehyde dehydrogenase [Bacteroidota bacterium]
MMKNIYAVPIAENEIIKSYAPETKERVEIEDQLNKLKSQQIEIAMEIGGEKVKTNNLIEINPPHEISHVLGHYHKGEKQHVEIAINAALEAKEKWENMPWKERAAIFLKAASLLAGPYRAKINAATMLAQSKNVFQAEIDSACELIDFYRFNVQFMNEIMMEQPISDSNNWNKTEQRPLEGFVFALTPFNFTSIAGNLPTAPAMMGNTVVWKPSHSQVYSANVIMEVLKEAGLPDGVINMVLVSGRDAADAIFEHPDFAGIHYTGSTEVFQSIWERIGKNIKKYKSYPRIVGETGGKDFIVVHKSANIKQTATAISRGAFEYQGQKCSAASRVYIPDSIWPELKSILIEQVKSFKMGNPEDFTNFINAVINEEAYTKIISYIEKAKSDEKAEIICGGNYSKDKGYFIDPTIILTTDPAYITLEEEIFGPVVTLYVYKDNKYNETLDLVNQTSPYALTGSIFATDREAIILASNKLKQAAGNFYINDKPTGAVVGQQPFGGARASGTNDKAGSKLNLLRWVSPRTVKENFIPPEDYKYPFMEK